MDINFLYYTAIGLEMLDNKLKTFDQATTDLYRKIFHPETAWILRFHWNWNILIFLSWEETKSIKSN